MNRPFPWARASGGIDATRLAVRESRLMALQMTLRGCLEAPVSSQERLLHVKTRATQELLMCVGDLILCACFSLPLLLATKADDARLELSLLTHRGGFS
jgi:hypothetical protein